MARPPGARRRRPLAALGLALALLGATACSGGGDEPAPAPDVTPTPTPTPPPTATALPDPANDACYALSFEDAVSPTVAREPRPCRRAHTSQTYAVGRVDNLVDGHLLAVDSEQVQADVARRCPAQLPDLVGGSLEQQRLSMLRSVWFTPTVEESDAGADWYRCDAIALAGEEELASLDAPLADVLTTPQGRERFAMCGTAAPGTADFERVLCSAPHAWRAISVVEFPAPRQDYPGQEDARALGQAPCEDAGAGVAGDPLDFQWAYEWPDQEQWEAGQTFGRCWAPD